VSDQSDTLFVKSDHYEKGISQYLERRMRMVIKEAKLPRICSTVAERSSVMLSSGIGFQFLTSTDTMHSHRLSLASHTTKVCKK